jgi:hypothetical protein
LRSLGTAVRSIAARLLAVWLACLVLAPIVLLATPRAVLAGRCDNGVHQPSLSALTAAPMTGTPVTVIAFGVVYRDTRGCEPSSVTLAIPGVGTVAMSRTTGDFKAGMTYIASRTLPVGSWPFSATATSGIGVGAKTVSTNGPAAVVITAPAPTPTAKPTPKPTPKPTSVATPKPTPKPTSKPTRTPKPTAKPSTGTKATPKPTTSHPATTPAGASASPSPSGSTIGGGLIGDDTGGTGDRASDGTSKPSGGPEAIVPILLAAVVAMFGGGLLVVARRRRDLTPESVTAAVADSPPVAPPVDATPIDLGPVTPVDAALQGDLPSRPALRFPKPAGPGTVRGTIAYRHVRVSAGPDDLRFAELARLEQRDEVEVIGEAAGYLQVRMPDGITGWVPRMVLVTAPAGAG